jgi:methionine biosynthesis protein MetW
MVLNEMLRVGRLAIVSFPNWGYWRCRLELLFGGRLPSAPDLPQAWHETPRWQALTVTDFLDFCRTQKFNVRQPIYLAGDTTIGSAPNLRARTAVFALEQS